MIGRGALIAGLAGVALFLIMFTGWFGESGWSSLGWFAVAVLAAAMLSAVAFAVVHFAGASVSLPPALSTLTAAFGGAAFVITLYRAIDPPGSGDVERELGVYLGLLATAAIAVGGYLGMQEERSR